MSPLEIQKTHRVKVKVGKTKTSVGDITAAGAPLPVVTNLIIGVLSAISLVMVLIYVGRLILVTMTVTQTEEMVTIPVEVVVRLGPTTVTTITITITMEQKGKDKFEEKSGKTYYRRYNKILQASCFFPNQFYGYYHNIVQIVIGY